MKTFVCSKKVSYMTIQLLYYFNYFKKRPGQDIKSYPNGVRLR